MGNSVRVTGNRWIGDCGIRKARPFHKPPVDAKRRLEKDLWRRSQISETFGTLTSGPWLSLLRLVATYCA